MRSRTTLFLLLAVATAGCYKATIETGLTPSDQEIRQDWAHSFIAGLVPPATVETAARCPNGVAQVETQQSFLNMVANIVTLGIYSPMTIRVQCAAAGAGSEETAFLVPPGAGLDESTRVLNAALSHSAARQHPVLVLFE